MSCLEKDNKKASLRGDFNRRGNLIKRVTCLLRLPQSLRSLAMTSFVLLLALFFSATANAGIVESGSCGTNCVYTIDDADNFVATALKSGDEGYVAGQAAVVSSQFQNKNIASVTLSPGISSVGQDAFQHNNISSLNIPDSVSYIGQHAFRDNKLNELNLPSTVTGLGWGAFEQNLVTSVTVPSQFTTVPGAFMASNPVSSVTIPDTVTEINNWAFGNNPNLTSITIPDSVVAIWDAAFYGSGLQEVVLGDSVEIIGYDAFYGNNNLTKIVIPDTMTTINPRALGSFSDVENLQIMCKGTAESCENLKNLLANYSDGNGHSIDLSDKVELADAGSCDSANYYWDGEECVRESNAENRSCHFGWEKQGNYCAMLPCQSGYKAENYACVPICSEDKVFWKDACYDEYPFAKKRFTPAEAAQFLKDDDNFVILTFKK